MPPRSTSRSKGACVTVSLPDTMRDTSSRSLISCSCVRRPCSRASKARSASPFGTRASRSSPSQVSIVWSGERSSWERTARNASFAELAASACWRARSATRRRSSFSSSARRRECTSSIMPTHWRSVPSAASNGTPRAWQCRYSPESACHTRPSTSSTECATWAASQSCTTNVRSSGWRALSHPWPASCGQR